MEAGGVRYLVDWLDASYTRTLSQEGAPMTMESLCKSIDLYSQKVLFKVVLRTCAAV